MPGGDRTGPMGLGSLTGRAYGFCAGSGRPGYATPGRGLATGFGSGRGPWGRASGGGRGRRNMFHATGRKAWQRFGGYGAPCGYPGAPARSDPKVEKEALENKAEALQSELDAIKKRLAEMEAAGSAH